MRVVNKWRVARILIQVSIIALVALGPWFGFSHGSICTLTVAGVTLSCPLGLLQLGLGAGGIPLGMIIAVIIPILITLLIGRVFCGFLCPTGVGLEEIKRLRGSGKSKSNWRNPFIGVVVLASILASSTLFYYPIFCIFCPVGVICRNVISYAQYGVLSFDILFIPAIFAFEALFKNWCPTLCPLGITMTLISRFNMLNPEIDGGRCVDCQICEEICPMNVPIMEARKLSTCSKCLKCSDICPTKAIKWRWRRANP